MVRGEEVDSSHWDVVALENNIEARNASCGYFYKNLCHFRATL
jgi:hypothetical protein